jgi:EF hand domain-containing protein
MIRKSLLVVAATGLMALLSVDAANAQSTSAKPTPAAKPAIAAAPNAQSVPPEVDAAFAAWDADRSGALSLQEFRSGWMMMRRASETQARLRGQFDTIDANRNGGIDANEYANLVLVKRAGKSAPLLSAFDANRNQRLEFPEYLEFIKRMTQPQAAPAPKKSP